ncbi:MAG: 50S ribosomal protein L29 [Candidatus Cloacimonadia bacterium]
MKIYELREMTEEELKLKREDLEEELYNLHFQKAMNKLENPMRIRQVKRSIAQVNTVLKERARSIPGKAKSENL